MEPIRTENLEQTLALGKRLGQVLSVNSILCLHGDLGAGKTQLVKGIVHGAALVSPEHVSSPTFVYLNIYDGPKKVFHFDLYRMHDCDEFLSMGFDDYFACGGICCIEWPERIDSILPRDAIHITLEPLGEEQRLIHIDRSIIWPS